MSKTKGNYPQLLGKYLGPQRGRVALLAAMLLAGIAPSNLIAK